MTPFCGTRVIWELLDKRRHMSIAEENELTGYRMFSEKGRTTSSTVVDNNDMTSNVSEARIILVYNNVPGMINIYIYRYCSIVELVKLQ